MWHAPSVADWTIQKPTLRVATGVSRAYTVHRETIQWWVCAAQKITQSYFVLFSLLFGSMEKVATEIALCSAKPQPVNSRPWNHRRSKGENYLLCPPFTIQISSALGIHVSVSVCGTFTSPSKGLLVINLYLVNSRLLRSIWIQSTVIGN